MCRFFYRARPSDNGRGYEGPSLRKFVLTLHPYRQSIHANWLYRINSTMKLRMSCRFFVHLERNKKTVIAATMTRSSLPILYPTGRKFYLNFAFSLMANWLNLNCVFCGRCVVWRPSYYH